MEIKEDEVRCGLCDEVIKESDGMAVMFNATMDVVICKKHKEVENGN